MNHNIKININLNDTESIMNKKLNKKNTVGESLEEDDLKLIVSTLNTVLAEQKTKETVNEFSFNIEVFNDDSEKIVSSFDEYELFNEASKYETLTQLILDYTKVTDGGAYDMRIWQDDETPAGTSAILALVNKDIKWIPDYINFLRSSDLDHEVDQSGDIDAIIKKYNWCEETCSLAIARLMSCHGQHGEEQIEELLEEGLSEYILENVDRFVRLLKKELEQTQSNPLYLSYMRNAEAVFIEVMLEDLDVVLSILNEKAVEDVKKELSNIWKNNNK